MASRNVSARPIQAPLPYGQIHGQVVARVRTLLSSYLLIWVVDVSLTHVFKLFPC